jgi:hypothetical protein
VVLIQGISVIGPFHSHIRPETPDDRRIGQRNQIGGYRPFTPFTSQISSGCVKNRALINPVHGVVQLLASGAETTLGFTNSSEVAAHVAVAHQDL